MCPLTFQATSLCLLFILRMKMTRTQRAALDSHYCFLPGEGGSREFQAPTLSPVPAHCPMLRMWGGRCRSSHTGPRAYREPNWRPRQAFPGPLFSPRGHGGMSPTSQTRKRPVLSVSAASSWGPGSQQHLTSYPHPHPICVLEFLPHDFHRMFPNVSDKQSYVKVS